MNKNKAVEIFLALLCIAGMIGCLATAGCSQNESKESLDIPVFINGQWVMAQYKSSIKGTHIMSYTKYRAYRHKSLLSSTCVGDMEAYPDPNAVKAVVKGAVEGVRGL